MLVCPMVVEVGIDLREAQWVLFFLERVQS